MGDKDEQRKQGEQDEQADVEGHGANLNEQDAKDEGEETPDVEGHFRSKSPTRFRSKGRF